MMTFNVHQLLHLAKSVSMIGPLWAHSAFVFESGNGRVVSCITAAKGASQQVLERIAVTQEVELLLDQLHLPESVSTVCRDMLGYPRNRASKTVQGASLLGRGKGVSRFSCEEQAALEAVGYPAPLQVHL